MPFEPINPPQFPKPIAPYSAGAKAGNTVYVSGVLALGEGGIVLHVGDAAAQTRAVLDTIRITLEAAGASLADVAMNHIFLKDFADYQAFNAVYAEYFPGNKPARYCVKAELVKPDCLVEIASVAHSRLMGEVAGLYWEEHGPADGPPVIFSPGLGGSATYWTPNLAALAERHRVILYDHRGTGRSDRALQPELEVDDMADDVLALLDGLGIARASLIGHAAGGVIGFAIALKQPDRLASLVVINGFAAPDPHFIRCMETRLALLQHSGVVAFVRAQPLFLYPARWISENWERLQAEEAGHIAHFQGAANVEARIAALATFDIADRLAEIGTPTLLIAAEDEMLVPDLCSERLEQGLPHARLARMRGGHACNITEPDSFNRHLLEFLGD